LDVGLIIIGTELLTGKRKDGHLGATIELLGRRGLELAWCQYLGDDPQRLVRALRASLSWGDLVFSCGGIGATPDDHTRAAAAEASGRPIERHPQLQAIIEARFGPDAHPQRIRMADLPRGCELIPNPVNRIAGFKLDHHHFVPGFPRMAWPMIEWVLDTHYRHLHQPDPTVELLVAVPDTGEGALIEIMERLVAKFPEIRLSCLPHMDGDYRETELGVRGRAAHAQTAHAWLCAALDGSGFRWERREQVRKDPPPERG
jgi:molybdopterin-biosynthesis enzyme MoeA-like protein